MSMNMRSFSLHEASWHGKGNRVVAHRGWSSRAPENTMAAFQLVLDNPNIGWIELDVQLSKDGIPVVIHDYTLNRTTNGKGWVHEHTYRELRKLNAGSWFGSKFKNERIPSLEQVLEIVGEKKRKLNIELKTRGVAESGLELKVIELVNDKKMQDDVVITSFDHRAVRLVKQLDSGLRTGLIIYGMPLMLREQLEYSGASWISMDYTYLYGELARSIIDAGYDLMAWTVNKQQDINAVIQLDPRLMICTNYPDRVLLAEQQI